MDRHIDPINNCVSREFKEGVDVFIAFSSNQTYFIEGKPCYFLVQDVKTENNVTREPYLAIFTESGSKVIIIYGRCIDETSSKLSGLKSHDCYVIMQRLFPFAFKELLPKNVHIAILGNFFKKKI